MNTQIINIIDDINDDEYSSPSLRLRSFTTFIYYIYLLHSFTTFIIVYLSIHHLYELLLNTNSGLMLSNGSCGREI